MQEITFRVFPPRKTPMDVAGPCFVLEQDNWNDYGFRTLYHLSFYPAGVSRKDAVQVGPVKILQRAQLDVQSQLITADFRSLDERFCSVGSALDYYERLQALGEIGQQALKLLRDVVAMPELVQEFASEQGWSKSLFRDQPDAGARFRYLASGLVLGHYAKAPVDQPTFSFTARGWRAPVVIDTTTGERASFEGYLLPDRVNVLVGRNGSGKSTLLARLARVAYGSPRDRKKKVLRDLGEIEPPTVGFPRIITVAFSPFDRFRLPGSDDRNRAQIAKEMQQGIGRFSFIGLRDLVAEIDLDSTGEDLPDVRKYSPTNDQASETKLKSTAQLAEQFVGFRSAIHSKGRTKELGNALARLERGLFSNQWGAQGAVNDDVADVRQRFNTASTGHKITLLVIFGLLANLEPHSLVLFDEPETHLHPPLLAAMMHALRGILEAFEATAIVATHSPVVVQESLARHVHVVRREEDIATIVPVSTETFGESIATITAEVFGLESDATDFHSILDRLLERYKNLDKIEALFKDGAMSHQARAYLMARMATAARG